MTTTSSSTVIRDNSINLSWTNKTSKIKISNISHIPIDIISDEDLNVEHNHVQLISGISKDYFDHGDQSFVSTSCHAKLWQNEALIGNKDGNKTSFSMCCGNGKVELPKLKQAPEDYQNLYHSVHPKGKHFLNNIRLFNSMFSFTSMGRKVDSSVNKGKGPYIFRLSSQNYHCMGNLLPIDGSQPKFSQLYIYDIENELSNRQHAFSTQKDGCKSTSQPLDIEIIRFLKVMLDSTNELVKCYRMARNCFNASPNIDLKLRLIGRRQQDGRTYNLPTASEVAALIVSDIGNSIDNRDIIVTTKSGSRQRINELHPAYLALQYPLLFPYGDDGYRVDIPHRGVTCSTNSKRHYFIAITCNPKWPKIQRFIADKNLKPEDRPDILSRLFKMKLDSLIKDLKKNSLLDSVEAVVYTVEFQKRGLPHAHICLFMHSDYKLPTVEHIDHVISAEIPNKDDDPELYALVSEFMMHGPCGSDNPKCPCMIDNKCSKNFPKTYIEHTSVDENGYPIYRRRNDGSFVEKSSVKLDKRSVVPYHKLLLKRYQAHINVEWCNQGASIKYLFKYINKGPDKATIAVVPSNNADDNDDVVDEIKNYFDCRYLSACEASWRIFKFDVHFRTPSIVRLPFHLPGQQNVVYGADDDIEDVLNKQSVSSSMFLAWMECNEHNKEAHKLSYVEFPTKFVWKFKDRCWKPREKGFSVSRIHTVSPNFGEVYFLRILLNKVKDPKCFADIRTVNGHVCATFREVCYALGLLEDDKEYIDAIEEASHSGLSLSEDQVKNLTLYEIEIFLLQNNSSLKDFDGMPYPDHEFVSSSNNRLITKELDFDRTTLLQEFYQLLGSLTNEQRGVFDDIITNVKQKKGGVFFVYGYGGTGKTFLWKTLSAALRSEGGIVLNVTSSGIASLLLTGGRTGHS
uniref:ATP-dependent DNA helicase n=1 Tax=Lactuca sativa TaxID=4236 RepID=A0A9R1VF48_LACSA|nr:hypothetical protein LSAT_V11C500232920 [Lactuca sativa]